jgi:tight adherence protein C
MEFLNINIVGLALWDLLLQVVLSAGIIASVTLLIVAVFGQPGEVRMSPQRQAALATGHADRATVFENPYLRPMLWLLLSLSHRLSMPRLKGWVRRQLLVSGNPNYYIAEEYLALALFTGLALGGLAAGLYLLAFQTLSLAPLLVGLVLGSVLTLVQLHLKAADRMRVIVRRVPYALDLISLAMGAGATFVEAVSTVTRERSDDPFNVELSAMLSEIDLGATRRRALENLASRVPVDSLKSVVASVIQAEELGTPLSEALHAQAALMRQQRSVRAETAAAVISVRILLPSLLILMSVVLVLFAPAIVRFVEKGGLF